MGGGLWIMSSHASNPQAVAKVLVGLATSTVSQNLSQGYPGYIPAAKSWIAAQDASGFWATPLAPAFATAATEVWTGWAETPWDVYRHMGQHRLAEPDSRPERLVPATWFWVADLELRTKRRLPSRHQAVALLTVSDTTSLPVPERAQGRAGRGRVGGRHRAGYAFVAVYLVLLLLFGVVPTVYALYLAFTKERGGACGPASPTSSPPGGTSGSCRPSSTSGSTW